MPKGQAVASPALGGLIIGHEVARAMSAAAGKNVRFIFTERDTEGKMTLRRGFTVEPEEEFVVIEDVITTGGSTLEVVHVLQSLGAKVLAIGSIIDRSGGTANLGYPYASLTMLKPETWPADFCPLCKEGVPVEKPGSRK